MCSCSSTACPLTGLEGQLFGMRIVVEEEEELVEVVALQPTPQAYSLTPVVEQSEVATEELVFEPVVTQVQATALWV